MGLYGNPRRRPPTALCGIDEDGDGDFDASGVTALADAIGKHQ